MHHVIAGYKPEDQVIREFTAEEVQKRLLEEQESIAKIAEAQKEYAKKCVLDGASKYTALLACALFSEDDEKRVIAIQSIKDWLKAVESV